MFQNVGSPERHTRFRIPRALRRPVLKRAQATASCRDQLGANTGRQAALKRDALCPSSSAAAARRRLIALRRLLTDPAMQARRPALKAGETVEAEISERYAVIRMKTASLPLSAFVVLRNVPTLGSPEDRHNSTPRRDQGPTRSRSACRSVCLRYVTFENVFCWEGCRLPLKNRIPSPVPTRRHSLNRSQRSQLERR